MANRGFGELTVDGIVNEVGTTRQTFYRRYATLSLLALEVLLTRFGDVEEVDTGSLESDLMKLQRDDVAMMTTPLIQKNLPGLFEDIRTIPEVRDLYYEKLISPRRANVSRVIQRAVERREIPDTTDADIEYVWDQLFGPLLNRVLMPMNAGIDDKLARRTVSTVMRELRRDTATEP